MLKKLTVVVGLIVVACALATPAGAEVMVFGPEDGPEAVTAPVVEVGVASPRAALMRVPPQADDAARGRCPSQGTAFNFARPDFRLTVQQGTLVKVRLSEETEGVWYDGAFGQLATFLLLEMKAEEEWQPLNWDFAQDVRHGPSVGVARDVSTRFEALDPGTYRLRAKVLTYALPLGPDFGHLLGCADDAYDVIHITVHVVAEPVAEPVPEFPEPAEDMPHEFLE